MPRKEKKYHYIYKTTCKVNNKFYVGIHSTNDLNDGYVGSGKRLWYSIKKHGKENFVVEFLEFFENRKNLIIREIEMVNEDFIQDPMCMNLIKGGGGTGSGGGGLMKRTPEWCNAIAESLRGVQHTENRKQKNSESQIGLQAGNKNPRARTFNITDPEGIEYKIKGGLNNFCIEHKLSTGCMLKVAKGNQQHHQKWTIKYEGPYKKQI